MTPRDGQTAIVTTAPAVTFESKRRSSSGRWSITTLSDAGSTHNDDLVAYSDLGGPTQVLITDHSTYMNRFSGVVGDTNNIRATLTANNMNPITSSRFPGGGDSRIYDHTIDSDPDTDTDGDGDKRNDYDTTRFDGMYDSAWGTFECMETCTVAHEGRKHYDNLKFRLDLHHE